MKVKELIQLLKDGDQEVEVHFAYNYGDHWHTMVAPKIKYLAELPVEFSDYHRMPKLVLAGNDMDDDEYNAWDAKEKVVVLSSSPIA